MNVRFSIPLLFLLGISPVLASESYVHYITGLAAEQKGDLSTALAEYQKVVENDPTATEVYKDIAQVNLRAGRLDEALQAAEHVKNLAPKDSAAHLFLGNVYIARGEFKQAVQTYEEALKIDPKNLNVIENIGNFYAATNPKLAFDYYRRYLEIEPNAPEVYFQMGYLHQRLGETVMAVSAYRQSAKLATLQPAPLLALADLYETQKSTAEAVAAYQDALRLDPRNPLLYFRLGKLFYDSRQWSEAESAFQNVKALTPNDAAVYYWLARTMEERHRWKEASDAAQQAYTLGKNSQFLPLWAYYLSMQHRTAECAYVLEQARAADPKNGNTLLFLGMAYLDLDNPTKALPVLESAQSLLSNDAQVYFQLGVTYDRLGRFDEAVKQFEKVLSVEPKSGAALNYLGYTFADHNTRLDEAETYLQRATTLDPNNGAFMDSLGWLRFRQGRLDEGLVLLQRSIARGMDPLIYEHLGEVAWKKGDAALTVDAWTKASVLDAKSAKKLQKRLDEAAKTLKAQQTPSQRLQSGTENFQKVSQAESDITLSGRWNGQKINVAGHLLYAATDQVTLAINGPTQEPWATLVVKGEKVTVTPESAQEMLGQVDVKELSVVAEFLSGALLQTLASEATSQGWSGEKAVLTGTVGKMTIQLRDGLPRQMNKGSLKITIHDYDVADNHWVPRRMQLKDSKNNWKADIRFSQWRVSEKPAEDKK